MSFERFVDTLNDINLEPTAEEIADILWLAQHVQISSDSDINSQIITEHEQKDLAESIQSEKEKSSSPTESAGGVHLLNSDQEQSQEDGTGSLIYRTPAGVALPGRLEIARSLRPFM